MANRVHYLKMMAKNKDNLVGDMFLVHKNTTERTLDQVEISRDANDRINKIAMLTDDPKIYYQALGDLKSEENEKGYEMSKDHLFDDRYVVSDKTFK